MTEFEMAYLTNDIQIALTSSTATLFSIVSGFLVVSYYAAHRLTLFMIVILIGVYAWAFLGTAFVIERQAETLIGMSFKIEEVAKAGSGLEWHAAASPAAPGWVRQAGPYANLIVSIVIFVSTLFFFFHSRRVNRKT